MKDINFLKSNGIDVDSGIEILGDIEVYEDILNEFLECSIERKENMDKYFNEEDMDNYAIEVHAMKGDAKYLGFTKLADMALEHQLKSETQNKEFIKNTYEDLILEFDRIVNIVKEYIDK